MRTLPNVRYRSLLAHESKTCGASSFLFVNFDNFHDFIDSTIVFMISLLLLKRLFSNSFNPKRRRAASSFWCVGCSRFCSLKNAEGGWGGGGAGAQPPNIQTWPN